MPSTLTVTTSVDEVNPDDGVLSLREAIAAANNGDKITFDANITGANAIFLTMGQLTLNQSLTIEGVGKDGTDILSASARVFDVTGNVTVRLANLELAGSADHGGTVLNEGATLGLANCWLGGGAFAVDSDAEGGAIYNAAGTVSLSNCSINGSAYARGDFRALGGAIYNAAGASLQVTNSNFVFCSALQIDTFDVGRGLAAGGAIYNAGGSVSLNNVVLDATTDGGAPTIFVEGGTALGGAIFSTGGTLSISNCTFDGNSAMTPAGFTTAAGGAIYVASGSVQIQNSTFTGNYTIRDASIVLDDIYIAGGSVCISKNTTVGDIFGPYTIC